MEDPARKLFPPDLTDRERACFEAGIALASIFHQFAGTPVSRSPRVLRALERAMEASLSLQPFRERVEVKIDARRVKERGKPPYSYSTLRGDELVVKVSVKYGGARAVASMRFVPELGYPLMYIERVEGQLLEDGEAHH
ncbi:MAG: dihydroneopterin aldolase family protein [Candidatus Nezhaarchaeota archaeon]|nr:dihydroneopterin aldolase family protein [Candidatus Nezhaarchaeota archaeon]